jgi:hypothetical protein
MENVKPSNLRKYIFEYCILGLSAAVGFLFHQYQVLNDTVRNILINENVKAQSIITDNTQELHDVRTYLITTQKNQK